MPIITLTSDMGLRDYYVAAVKGYIFQNLENAQIIDISHNISPFSISEASFVIKNVFRDFPPGTIHIISINPEQVLSEDGGNDILHLAVEYEGHFFIGADNGMFSLMFERQPDAIHELTISQDSDDTSFPTKYIFAKAACHLARGGTLPVLGPERKSIRQALAYHPTQTENSINGIFIYIDSYGNGITNITEDIFNKVGKGRAFTLSFRGGHHSFDKICTSYNDVDPGNAVVLFTSSGYLELAISRGVVSSGGSATSLMGIELNTPLTIEFEQAPSSLADF